MDKQNHTKTTSTTKEIQFMRLTTQLSKLKKQYNSHINTKDERISFLETQLTSNKITSREILDVLSDQSCNGMCHTREDVQFLMSIGLDFRKNTDCHALFTNKALRESFDLPGVMKILISTDGHNFEFIKKNITPEQIKECQLSIEYLLDIYKEKREELNNVIYEEMFRKDIMKEDSFEEICKTIKVDFDEKFIEMIKNTNEKEEQEILSIAFLRDNFDKAIQYPEINKIWDRICSETKLSLFHNPIKSTPLYCFNDELVDKFIDYIMKNKEENDNFIFCFQVNEQYDKIASATNSELCVSAKQYLYINNYKFKSDISFFDMYPILENKEMAQSLMNKMIDNPELVKFLKSPNGINFINELFSVCTNQSFKEYIDSITPKPKTKKAKPQL